MPLNQSPDQPEESERLPTDSRRGLNADKKLQSEVSPQERESLKRVQGDRNNQLDRARELTAEEAQTLAKRGERVIGVATGALGFSPVLEDTKSDGSKSTVLPGRSQEEVANLQRTESEAQIRKLPFDPAEPVGKPIQQLEKTDDDLIIGKSQGNSALSIELALESAKQQALKDGAPPEIFSDGTRYVEAGTPLEIRGQKYNLSQLSAQSLDVASDATDQPKSSIESMQGTPAAVGTDGVKRYQGHISNVPEITRGIQDISQAQALVGGITEGLGNVVHEGLNYLSQPQSVEKSLLSTGPALDNAVNYYFNSSHEQIGKDAQEYGSAGIQALEDSIGHPMSQAEIGQPAGEMASIFVPLGAAKALSAEEMELLGGAQKLENMTAEQLEAQGLKRFEMPKIKLDHDEFSIKATIPGDNVAFVRAQVPSPGVVDVSSIYRGSLPGNTGGDFLATTLKGHKALPTKELRFSGITNGPTLEAFESGASPANSVLGKTGTATLEKLGLKAKDYRFEQVRGKINLVIEVEK